MRHKHASLEISFRHDIRQASRMIDMEMRDEQHINRRQIELVVERKRGEALVCGMHPGIQHDRLSLVLEDMARATNFIAAAETDKVEVVGFIPRRLGDRRGGEGRKGTDKNLLFHGGVELAFGGHGGGGVV